MSTTTADATPRGWHLPLPTSVVNTSAGKQLVFYPEAVLTLWSASVKSTCVSTRCSKS